MVGFGEVGSSLGLGLKSHGVEVVAFDKGYRTPPFGESIQKRAREAGVPLVGSVAEVAAGSDLILGIVPGSVALKAATEVASCLKPGQFYVDMGTATLLIKEQMAGLVEKSGAAFVDVAIMGLTLLDGRPGIEGAFWRRDSCDLGNRDRRGPQENREEVIPTITLTYQVEEGTINVCRMAEG